VSTPIKNPTSWRPPSGQGFVLTPGAAFVVDKSGNFIVDKSGNFIMTTPSYTTPKQTTTWTQVG
jgi:hypothetical protein